MSNIHDLNLQLIAETQERQYAEAALCDMTQLCKEMEKALRVAREYVRLAYVNAGPGSGERQAGKDLEAVDRALGIIDPEETDPARLGWVGKDGLP